VGIKIESVFEPSERIVSMVEHRGEVYVATERRVYRMRKDDFTDTVAFDPVIFHQAVEQ
jgi:hypothetical protein